MAEQTAPDAKKPAAKTPDGADRAAAKSGGGAVKVAGLVLGVMLAEAAVLYFVLAPAGTAAADVLPGEERRDADVAEVAVGDFSTTNAKAVPGSLVHLTFKLTALVPEDRVADFTRAIEEQHPARVRQAANEVARAAEIAELDDPRLTALKSRLRAAVNTVIGESLVREFVVAEFKALEQ